MKRLVATRSGAVAPEDKKDQCDGHSTADSVPNEKHRRYSTLTTTACQVLTALVMVLGLAVPSIAQFTHYSPVTVQTGQVTGTLTNFPMLVCYTDNRLRTIGNGGNVADAQGDDVRPSSTAPSFTAITGYQKQFYDASAGTWCGRVLIASLTDASVVYLYYGDAALSADGSSTAVWNANYTGAWDYRDGTTLSVLDRTATGNNWTNSGVTAAAGKVDGGAEGNGTDQFMSRANLAIPTTGTLRLWWKPTETVGSSDAPVFIVADGSSNFFHLYPYSDGTLFAGWYNNTGANDDRIAWTISGITINTWYFVTLTWTNSGTTELRVDGVSKGTTPSLDATWDTTASSTATVLQTGSVHAAAVVDEMALSNVARPPDWIAAEFNNESAMSTFAVLGTEVPVAAGGAGFQLMMGVGR